MSSQKKWFLLYNNQYHLGPFDTNAIRFKLSAGELVESDLIWAVGMKNWETISSALTNDHKTINKIDETIKADEIKISKKISIEIEELQIPPLPEPEPEPEPESESENIHFETPPLPVEGETFEVLDQLPDIPMEDVFENHPDVLAPSDVLVNSEADLNSKLNSRNLKNSSKYIIHYRIMIVCLIFVSISGLFLFTDSFEGVVSKLNISDGKLFYLRTFNNRNVPELKILFTNKKTILISTNRLKQGTALITFSSVKGRVLSESSINFKGIVQINGNIAILDDFKFSDGIKIISGEYRVSFKVLNESLKDKILNLYYKSSNSILKTQILFQGPRALFEKNIKHYKHKKIKYYLSPLEEKLGLVNTLKAIVEDYKNKLKSSLKIKKRNYRINRKKFLLDYYNLKIGPILTTLVVNNVHSKDKVIFENIVQTGKRFGQLAVKTINQTSSRLFRGKVFEFIVQLNTIKLKLEKSELKLTAKIKYYKRLFKKE